MTKQEIDALLTDLTRCTSDEKPLDFSTPDNSNLYIHNLHGNSSDPIAKIAKRIKASLGQSVQLFTGHPGNGKSTELYRLKKKLTDDLQEDVRVYFLDVKDWASISQPLNLSSFLVGLLASWARQADAQNKASRSWITRFYDFLNNTEIIPKGFKLDTPTGYSGKLSLEFALETDASFRALLDAEVKKQGAKFVEQAHAFIRQFKQDLCGEHNGQPRKCVLIVDSLEQIRGFGKDAGDVYGSLEKLFIGDRQALQLPDVHVVYSISPFLYVNNAQLPALYGAGVIVKMPSVHVFKKQGNDIFPDEEGVACMRDMLTARFPRWQEVLTQAQLDRLILGTGGDLRDFLRAVAEASLTETQELPLPEHAIDAALSAIKPPYESIESAHIAWLKQVETSHEANPNEAVSSVQMFQYLASKHVLTYVNGETWYSVHPLLRDWVLTKSV